MKYLGIDYGSKYTGLAISDSQGMVATAYSVVSNDSGMISSIEKIITNEGIGGLVIGTSHNLDGSANTIQKYIDIFSKKIVDVTGLPIHAHTEIFSSMQAKWGTEKSVRRERKQEKYNNKIKQGDRIDAQAAAIVLQSFLDSQK